MNVTERMIKMPAVICAAALLAACASLPAPRSYLPQADQAGLDVRGSWANVRVRDVGKHHLNYSGELVAVRSDSLFLYTSPGGIQALGTANIDRVEVVLFDPKEDAVYGLGALGGFSTLSTGFYFALGFPIWLIIGSSAGATSVDDAVTAYPRETETFAGLAPYARFPQGMPPNFRPSAPPVRPPVVAAPPAPHLYGHDQQPPGEPLPQRPYVIRESSGNGLVGSVAGIEGGKVGWSASYHQRVHDELFAMAGYTKFDKDAADISQWWIGMRLGEPLFVGAKYIYSTQLDQSESGISGFFGFITPASQHVSVGALAGYDKLGFDKPRTEDLWWVAFQLQVTLVNER